MSDPALCQDRVAICTRFSLFLKLAFINTSPQTVDGLLISISHLLSLNEKQFLGQGSFFFWLKFDYNKEFLNIIAEQY